MASKKQSMILGYVRRMRAISEFITQMQDIEQKYEREFGHSIKDDLVEGAAGAALAAMAARMRDEQTAEQPPAEETAPPQRGASRVACGHAWEGSSGNCDTHVCGVMVGHTAPHRCRGCSAMSILNLNPAGYHKHGDQGCVGACKPDADGVYQ